MLNELIMWTPGRRIGSHLDDDEQVAETDDEQRSKEADGGGVENEGGGPHVLWLGPDHVAGVKCLLKEGKRTQNLTAGSTLCSASQWVKHWSCKQSVYMLQDGVFAEM